MFDLYEIIEEVSRELIPNISNMWCDFTGQFAGHENYSSKL